MKYSIRKLLLFIFVVSVAALLFSKRHHFRFFFIEKGDYSKVTRLPIAKLTPVPDVPGHWQRVTFDEISLLVPNSMSSSLQMLHTSGRGWQFEDTSTKVFIARTEKQAEDSKVLNVSMIMKAYLTDVQDFSWFMGYHQLERLREDLQNAVILRSPGAVAVEVFEGSQIQGALYRSSNRSAWFEWQLSDRSASGIIFFEYAPLMVGDEDWVRQVCRSVRKAAETKPLSVIPEKPTAQPEQ